MVVGLFASIAGARTAEIGIRMALGAPRLAVVAEVLRHSPLITGVGLVVGLAGAAATTRSLSSLLYGLTPLDMSTFAAVAFALLALTVLASVVPARRATTVDPVVALRAE